MKKTVSISQGSIKPEHISEVLLSKYTNDCVIIKEIVNNILLKKKNTEKTCLKVKKF
jgi:hypothetical protein